MAMTLQGNDEVGHVSSISDRTRDDNADGVGPRGPIRATLAVLAPLGC
jgi:hypothetical protein